jgi:hypothetical protein
MRATCVISKGAVLAVVLLLATGPAAAATFTVTTTADSGAGSLRQAIIDANTALGADVIEFAIPGAGPHTIAPATALPALTGPVDIDGTTQSGAVCPMAPGTAATLLIVLNGASAPGGADVGGLTFNDGSDGSTVSGLVLQNYNFPIWVADNSDDHTFTCNHIGTDVTGMAVVGNAQAGLWIKGAGCTVGGFFPGSRNVISGGANANGVMINGFDADGNTVANNYIGVGADGMSAIPNRIGVNIQFGAGNLVDGNVISGNSLYGVAVGGGGSPATRVIRNVIGVAFDETTPLPNGEHGVIIDTSIQNDHSTAIEDNVIAGNGGDGIRIGTNTLFVMMRRNEVWDNGGNGIYLGPGVGGCLVGTATPADRNWIRGNAGDGVRLHCWAGTANQISLNRIHGNTGLGIDLCFSSECDYDVPCDGVTANDPGDGDSGPNGLQNYPVLLSATTDGVSTAIAGTLGSTPNLTGVIVQLFANDTCDDSGHGEGEELVVTTLVNTDGSGNGSFVVTVPSTWPPGSTVFTATATDPDGSTSEFSACVTLREGQLNEAIPALGTRGALLLALLLAGGALHVLRRAGV